MTRSRRPAATAQLALVLAAFLFGSTFVVVKDAVKDVGPVPFLAVRFAVGALLLVPFALNAPKTPGSLRGGVWCGLALVAGYVLQTVGLQYTSSSRSALITYLLVLIVPVISAVRSRRPPNAIACAGITTAVVGLFLLNGARVDVGKGEALTLLCALAFAIHIALLAELSPRHDAIRLTAVQLAVVAVACAVPGVFTGGYHFTARAWWAAGYLGVVASALAFVLMVWAQRVVPPARTALLLMMEPVFAAIVGYAAGDRLGVAGAIGAALILTGIAVAEGGELWRARRPVGLLDRPGEP